MEKKHFKKYNGDFKVIYCEDLQRNYWLLGYFGGGALNISDAHLVAQDYAEETGVPLESVVFDDVSVSRFVKYFKYCFSSETQVPLEGALIVESFHQFLVR